MMLVQPVNSPLQVFEAHDPERMQQIEGHGCKKWSAKRRDEPR